MVLSVVNTNSFIYKQLNDLLQFSTNNSIQHYSFIYTQLSTSK